MEFIGLAVSVLAALFMIIGLMPLLGWLNWVTTLPLAFIGAVLNVAALSRHKSVLAVAGLALSGIVFVVGSFRLLIGCGVFLVTRGKRGVSAPSACFVHA